jgi:hypothetical protein
MAVSGPFVMSYFTIEAEALHLAVSADGFTWRVLNGGQPILYSTVGNRSIRDPFLVRTADGLFHLLFTDSWHSRFIGHCTSPDLIHWGEQRLLPVMANVPECHNCWAPECFFDREANVYRLIWSSTVASYETEDVWDHRIWSATTVDFQTLSPSRVFFDPGYPVIDATVVDDGNRYVMIYKDERGYNRPTPDGRPRPGPDHKAMRVAVATRGAGPFEVVTGLVTPHWTEGPTVFRADGRWVMFYDHFIEHRYGAATSDDLIHWTEISPQVQFPPDARHACVIAAPIAVVDGLLRTMGGTL